MKDPRMKGVESAQPGFEKLKRSARKKSFKRSQTRGAKKRKGSKY